MSLVLGVLGWLLLLVGLAGSMSAFARGAARSLGVPDFEWFGVRPGRAAWWRRLLLRLASATGPLALSIALFWLGFVLLGVSRVSTRIEVHDGAARDAGMRDGDRIVKIAGIPITSWEQVPAMIVKKHGPTRIELERDGANLELEVTPRAGRIGVAPRVEAHKLGAWAALRRAAWTPFAVIRASANGLAERFSLGARPDFVTSVGIARESGNASSRGSELYFLAMIAAYLWPFFAGVPLFDAATLWIFRSTHPAANTSPAAGYRLARLRQALVFSLLSYLPMVLGVVLTVAGLPRVGSWLVLQATPMALAMFPLLWLGGRLAWGRGPAAALLAGSLLIPCFIAIVAAVLVFDLKRKLEDQGFRVGWLRADPRN